ncbi:MotA/TolQ/ExbB proton channel family protein [Deferrisoma camini]|uniref:MotA/TolQ/ExbB proton channel family protein n=1 Tax=Deferrisoma camini TaxID=1035120 RepID=UPI00046D24A6|nr:MotA/TolQ/ExbB proton channel family protein [Deferrisoma camini]
MWELFQKGGPTMWVLVALSVAGLAVIVERLLVLYRARTDTEAFTARIAAALEAQRYEEALEMARRGTGAMARILAAGLERIRRGRTEVEKAIEARGNLEVSKLERGLVFLQAVAKTAPLVGFFGTVSGMIKAFEAMGRAGLGNPANVALGISEALITTAAGLAVAIPAFFCHALFVGKVNRFVMELEEGSIRFLEALEEAEERQAKSLARYEIGGEYLEI